MGKEIEKYIEEMEVFARENNVPIIRKQTLSNYKEEIKKYIEDKKEVRVLEIGTAIGYSSINIASISKNITINTIEKNSEMVKIAKENLMKTKLEEQINIFEGDAVELLKNNKEIVGGEYDIVFIDANKSKYLEYFNITKEILKKDGIIFLDNVLFGGRVLGEYTKRKHRTIVTNLRILLQELIYSKKYNAKLYDIEDGYIVYRK